MGVVGEFETLGYCVGVRGRGRGGRKRDFWSRQAAGDRGELDKAAERLDAGLKLKPESVGLLVGRGLVYWKQNQNDQALEKFDAALKQAPDDTAALYDRALVYDDQGHYDRAIRDLDEAIKADPADASNVEERGEVYADLDDYQRAVRDFDQAEAARWKAEAGAAKS